jgi:hypothetical protein
VPCGLLNRLLDVDAAIPSPMPVMAAAMAASSAPPSDPGTYRRNVAVVGARKRPCRGVMDVPNV